MERKQKPVNEGKQVVQEKESHALCYLYLATVSIFLLSCRQSISRYLFFASIPVSIGYHCQTLSPIFCTEETVLNCICIVK